MFLGAWTGSGVCSMKVSDDSVQPGSKAVPSPFLVAFTLLASYCIGANAAIALHEFGHALGCWIAGGRMLELVLGPQGFSGSYAACDVAAGRGFLIHIAGGAGFGALFGVLLLVAARHVQRGTVVWIVAYATGAWSIGNNGAYLLLGSLFPFDDALALTQEGIPRWVLFLTGLPLVVAFVPLFALFLHGIGLRREDSYWRWVLTIETALLSYLLATVGLRLLWTGGGHYLLLACSPVLLLLLASCAYAFLPRNVPPALEPRWTRATVVFAIGLLFMATEVLFFSPD
jgi:hypothetical protein